MKEFARSQARTERIAFRLSAENKAILKQRAAERGLDVQTYLEAVALGMPPRPRERGLNTAAKRYQRRYEQEMPIGA